MERAKEKIIYNFSYPKINIFLSAIAVSGLLLGCGTKELDVNPKTLPDGRVGMPYSTLVQVGNNDTPLGGGEVEKGSLPPGIAIGKVADDDHTLSIEGTPLTAGSYPFTLFLWCYGTNSRGQTARVDYVIDIAAAN